MIARKLRLFSTIRLYEKSLKQVKLMNNDQNYTSKAIPNVLINGIVLYLFKMLINKV
jgi:hypothetical protein